MFSMVHGGAWIGHLHHLTPHQLCSPNQPKTTNCTCKRWHAMSQISTQVGILKSLMSTNKSCWLGNEMMPASCTEYHLTIFELLPHFLSHLNQIFFVNTKEDNYSHFQHHMIGQNLVVEWSLQTLFYSMAFHCTTNSITWWFPMVSCKENLLCFNGKVLFIRT